MAAKIKDGLFIGDAETSQDPEFLELNKISNLINLAGREVPNTWATHGLVYLTYNWEDRQDFELFGASDDSVKDLVDFVDASIRHGVAVLLFSRRGIGRCSAAICAYLMTKYHWGFEKTYDFVYSKKPDIEINQGFMRQLFSLDKRLRAIRSQQLKLQSDDVSQLVTKETMRSKDWDPLYLELDIEGNRSLSGKTNSNRRRKDERDGDCIDESPEDELLLINSFLNSKQSIQSLPGPYRNAIDIPKAFKIRFNSELQEEDIHMLSTSPPQGSLAIPRRGVIKGRYSYSSSSTTSTSHRTENNRDRESDYVEYPDDTSESVVMAEEKVNSSSHGRNHRSGTSQAGYSYGAEGDSKDALQYNRDGRSGQNGTASNSSLRRDSFESEDKGVGFGRSDSYTSSRSGISGGDDLYRFMGLGDGNSGDGNRTRKQGAVQSQGHATAEERLRHLVADMQIGTGGSSGQRAPSPSQAAKMRGTPSQSSSSATPTLYDLATSVGGHASTGRSRRNAEEVEKSAAERDLDPLAAFELLQMQQQRGGAIRARHDLLGDYQEPASGRVSATSSASSKGRAPPGQPVRGAWVEGDNSSQGSTRKQQQPVPGMRPNAAQRSSSPLPGGGAATGSGTKADPQAGPRTYRHGSPAPNRISGGPGSSSSRASPSAGAAAPSRNTWGAGGSSIASVSSMGSLGSNLSASQNGYAPAALGRSDTNGRAPPQRPASPSVQQQRKGSVGSVGSSGGERERDRPASPGPQAGSRRTTAGPNPSPMRGSGTSSAGRARGGGGAGDYDGSTGSAGSAMGSGGSYGLGPGQGTRTRAASPGPGGGGVSTSLGAYASSLGIDLGAGRGGVGPATYRGAVPSSGGSGSGSRPSTPTRSWRF